MPSFSDFPNYISASRYNIDVSLAYLNGWLEQEKERLDLNPDFQRDYVWSEEQKERYMEHIIRGGISGREIYFNCRSYIQPQKTDSDLLDTLVIVDGKQRFSALTGFLDNTVKAFGFYLKEFDVDIAYKRVLGRTIRININDLQYRKLVLQWYLELNSGGTVHTKEELDKVKKMMLALG